MLMRGATRRSSELCGLEEILAARDCVGLHCLLTKAFFANRFAIKTKGPIRNPSGVRTQQLVLMVSQRQASVAASRS